jgi:membrane protease YdiL (CAAX protease family)
MTILRNANGQSRMPCGSQRSSAMVCVAVLFGFGHYYKGPAGVLDSTYSGLVLGTLYLLSGRNLWAPILAHGMSDTFAVLAVYMGWVN